MKTIIKISIIVILLLTSNLIVTAQKKVKTDSVKTKTSRAKEKKDLVPEDNYKDHKHYPNKALKSCELTSATEIQGYKCTNEILFYQSGKILEMTNAEPLKKWGFTIPINSIIHMHEKGYPEYCIFSEDVQIDSILVKGDGKVKTHFYPSGKLKGAVMAKNTKLQNIPILSHNSFPVVFHDNGIIQECTTYEEFTISKLTYDKKSTLFFDRKGKLIQKD